MADSPSVLTAPLVLEYPFTRTTGPVVGAYLTGLRERRLLGIRRADGSVLCPPLEYDPETAEPLTELVDVGDTGEVLTWSFCPRPRPRQPFDGPFAWALIRLDGADTALLHGVLVDDPRRLHRGLRVTAVWRDERHGHVTDLAGFVPVDDDPGASEPTP